MNNEQILLVKKTWKIFRDIDPALVGSTFYAKLFTDNRSLRKMFPKSMDLQYQKLIEMLSSIVARLDKLQIIEQEIIDMAQRHANYGVRPAHYKMVGTALLWTLQKGLGDDWNEEVKDAWTTCYQLLADTMIKSAIVIEGNN